MKRHILIIGGGISGLSVLHFLNKKFTARPDIELTLLEKEPQTGGTIQSLKKEDVIFETGPNGFLDNKPSTLDLVRELGLTDSLINASKATKTRYICVKDRLYTLPSGPVSFLSFPLLSVADKMRIMGEIFVPKSESKSETVYEFGQRRLGENFAKYFLDPMVSGIFGGDARDLNLSHAFPKIRQIEQEYGSLFKGLAASGIKKRKDRRKNSLTAGQPAGQLWSFQNGMGQLIRTLSDRYKKNIETGIDVSRVTYDGKRYFVGSTHKDYAADDLILAVPAYRACDLIAPVDPDLSAELRKISYAFIAVAGLVYSKDQFENPPKGFGYLRPTHEGREILGVLFSSNIFQNRCREDQRLFQIMIGGACHPQTADKNVHQLLEMAETEIHAILRARGKPLDRFLMRWEKGIPQYTKSYPGIYDRIQSIIRQHPCLHLSANYLDGVALNDCVANAKRTAENINF